MDESAQSATVAEMVDDLRTLCAQYQRLIDDRHHMAAETRKVADEARKLARESRPERGGQPPA